MGEGYGLVPPICVTVIVIGVELEKVLATAGADGLLLVSEANADRSTVAGGAAGLKRPIAVNTGIMTRILHTASAANGYRNFLI
jgi:hypothetical protein